MQNRRSPRPYHRLSREEFNQIKAWLDAGKSRSYIMRRSTRGHSTIKRISRANTFAQYRSRGANYFDYPHSFASTGSDWKRDPVAQLVVYHPKPLAYKLKYGSFGFLLGVLVASLVIRFLNG